jgi:hypothetical protein
MKQSNSRISVLFLISIFLFPQTVNFSKGCGGWDSEDIINTSMFIPEIIEETRFDPFFLSIWDYYDKTITEGRIEPNSLEVGDYNLQEWRSYFEGISEEQVNTIVYQKSIASMDSFMLACDKRLASTPEFYQFAQGKTNLKEGFVYLKTAKRIEKQLNSNPWEDNYEVKDAYKLSVLSDEVLSKYRSTSNKSLRMRYGFQYVRLCHARNLYKEGIRFVDSEFKFKPEDGFMYYRTLGYQAACYYRERKYDQANIIYARLYDLGEAFKFEAFQSFRPQTEEEWTKTLSLANNNREKEVLWHLFGVYANPLKGIKEIAAINPNSDLLSLLLVRAVNIAENNILSNPQYASINGHLNEQEERGYSESEFTVDPLFSWKMVQKYQLNELQELIKSIADQRTTDKGVWYAANAFLYYLNEDFIQCGQNTDLAEKNAHGNKMIITQVAINRLLLEATNLKDIREKDENKMMLLIEQVIQNSNGNPRHENAIRYCLRKMKAIYLGNGDLLMAELCESNIYRYFSSEELVQEMIDFMTNSSHSPYKKYLIGRYPIQVSELYDVLATARIYTYNFEGALEIYRQNPLAGKLELKGNPFNSRMVDCHDCDHLMKQRKAYTKQTFVEKMIELREKGDRETDPIERSNNYFLYANGLYNMTYYGNARLVSSTVIAWDYVDATKQLDNQSDVTNNNGYYDCKNAMSFYLMAKELNPNQEFKAKCTWLAAKCEHNLWLEQEHSDDDTGDFQSGVFFKKMKDQFSTTNYYKDVIEECGYFCQYINAGEARCIKNKDN